MPACVRWWLCPVCFYVWCFFGRWIFVCMFLQCPFRENVCTKLLTSSINETPIIVTITKIIIMKLLIYFIQNVLFVVHLTQVLGYFMRNKNNLVEVILTWGVVPNIRLVVGSPDQHKENTGMLLLYITQASSKCTFLNAIFIQEGPIIQSNCRQVALFQSVFCSLAKKRSSGNWCQYTFVCARTWIDDIKIL